MAEGIIVEAPVERQGYRFTAWVGSDHDGERAVLVYDPLQSRLIWPNEMAGRMPTTFRLRNGWQVFARENRWFTRGGGATTGAEVTPRPKMPAPAAAAMAETEPVP